MTSQANILKALQYNLFYRSQPMNGTDDAPIQITYQFGGASEPVDWEFTSTSYSGWQAFSSSEQTVVRAAFAYLENLLNIDFVEVSGSSDPDLNMTKMNLAPGVAGLGGWSASYATNPTRIVRWDGFASFDTSITLDMSELGLVLHEIGHALGLRHAFDSSILSGEELTTKYSIMNYASNPDTGEMGTALALYDLFALQDIWGATDFNTGNNTYGGGDWLIWDTAGTDTISAAGTSGGVYIRLSPGKFSTIDSRDDVVIAYGSQIERSVGSAFNDSLRGNWLGNEMTGGDGEDRIWGHRGGDRLDGGDGDDRLFGGRDSDKLRGGAGNDLLRGGRGRDDLFGEAGNDLLVGGRGVDVFHFALGDGRDRILDYKAGVDKIELTGLRASTSDVQSLMSRANGDVTIDFGGGDVLIVEDTTIRQVIRDFLFDV